MFLADVLPSTEHHLQYKQLKFFLVYSADIQSSKILSEQYLRLLSLYGICLPLGLPEAKCIFVDGVNIMLSTEIPY